MADGSGAALERLIKSALPGEQEPLTEALRSRATYLDDLLTAYLNNPFLRLSDEDARALSTKTAPGPLGGMVAARHAAMTSTSPRIVVFCMPKSGSSFVQSALRHALDLPFLSLTGFGGGAVLSQFGMNSREQELDELAILRAALSAPGGFVAQHHTRYTQYLGLQLDAYRMTPLLTLRNVLDCLVSFDDMMLDWRAKTPRDTSWVGDPYALPLDYPDRSPEDRYRLIGHSLGAWLIQYFVAWKRGARQGLIEPLVIRYERDLRDPERLADLLSTRLDFTPAQRARLVAYAANPDPTRARLNVGRDGRGRETVPDAVRQLLVDYAKAFGDDIAPHEHEYLLG